MEHTLHRQLKALYGTRLEDQEVAVEGYRIDAVSRGRLIEIQQGSLSALRKKVACLLERHRLTIVKPLAARKLLIKRDRAGGEVIGQRLSPARETLWDLFPDLVHFVEVFPHPRLTLEVLLTEQIEYRCPFKRRRNRGRDFRVEDRELKSVVSRHKLRTTNDLIRLLPVSLPLEFTTADLAREIGLPRWHAQKIAYCLRQTGAAETVGKVRGGWIYALMQKRRKAA